MTAPASGTADGSGDWLMWEAKAAPGQTAALLAWALDVAAADAQVYRSADRVVVITEGPLPDPPDLLISRPAVGWRFDKVQ